MVMEDLRQAATTLLGRADVSLIDLWISYWNHGGRCHPFEFDAFIQGILVPRWFDTEALASALEELSLDAAS
ncbi:hypothetical protein [Arthrobacter sp. Cr_A7]|uniref:hypothetical protein n=1 Tax=Arthrobacter sp. Cr_A7 TaxID=3031017 RepID=UPI0023DC2CAF|nr:hypothetical protein [Arthrobacter sp. Cr_A7]MDF2050535.1 hypothetical protein [Arthrobacter sp. Cr_A7]